MDDQTAVRVRANPKFAELQKKRNAFAWTLSVVMLVVYYGFILLVAFEKDLMATPVLGVITLGFPLGLGVILTAILLTGLYVRRANGEFDELTREIVGGEPARPAYPAAAPVGAAR
jgi:uncharacterized membrane protein (DUF485 family)